MTGKELYRLYVEANQELGVEVDAWEDLGDLSECWEMMAEKLERKED